MADEDLRQRLLDNVDAFNLWRAGRSPASTRPDLRKANLRGAALSKADLHRADLRGADLWEANLSAADLRGADLSEADLREADLTEANLIEADLRGAYLTASYLKRAHLRRANLNGAKLIRANLTYAKLGEAKLMGVDLTEADLERAFLVEADLSQAILVRTTFRGAFLNGAMLKSSILAMTDFYGSELFEADLSQSVVDSVLFINVNLESTRGLDSCSHRGPSHIDIQTLSASGRLPIGFLRGCGLPDTLIDYLPSVLNEPIQFYSCFISYSTKDQEFADRLHADLQNKGVRCWFAPHNMQGGKKIYEQIDEAIRLYERLLLILSPASMGSKWVETEIAKARKREVKENRRMLFPVRLVDYDVLQQWECFDSDLGKDSAREIREYYVPDFTNWKDHDAYQKEFDKLLRDLKSKNL